jgi:hypothetical protein
MSSQYFAIRIEPTRLVAAQIDDRDAAALLDAGKPILLGTIVELGKLAERLQRQLLTFSRALSQPVTQAARRQGILTTGDQTLSSPPAASLSAA